LDEKLAVLKQNIAICAEKVITTLDFKKIANFAEKFVKIAENSYHNMY
jgi:hypothetical protein